MNKTTINTTATAAVNAKFPAKYYDRQLLESAKTRFVHAEFGQKRPIPRNSGKYVNFRRWNLFDPETAISGLVEGETPTGQTLSQTDVEAEVKQYGAYVEVSDLLDLTAYDEVINDSAELLGEQLGTVVEWITRDAMCAGSNVQYAGGRAGRNALTSEDRLTTTEIRKAVRTLKRTKRAPSVKAAGSRISSVSARRRPHMTFRTMRCGKTFRLTAIPKLSTAEKSEDCSVLCLLKALRPKYFLRAFTMPLKRLRPHQKPLCLKTRPPKRRKNISPSAATPFISGAMNTRWIPKPRMMRIPTQLS